jgi:hypothetical protein
MDSLIVSHVLLKPIDIDLLRRKLKREFKLDGFGRINRIDILSINQDGFAEIKIGFRCTKKKDILELRDTVYYQICEQPVRMNLSDEADEGYWILSLKCLPSHNRWSDLGIADIKLNDSTDQVDTQKGISETDILQKMDELEDKVKRQQDVIYQLLGGLFNHDTQAGSVDELVSVLLKIQPLDVLKDTSKWTIYPTTRQGDENAEKIAIMQQKMFEIEDQNKKFKNKIYDLTFALQQLGASLYNQTTQQQSWRELRDIFIHDGGYDDLTEPLMNTSKWRHPTTRQGDENERRIDELEKKLGDFGTLFPQKITEERQNVTFDLCGNA